MSSCGGWLRNSLEVEILISHSNFYMVDSTWGILTDFRRSSYEVVGMDMKQFFICFVTAFMQLRHKGVHGAYIELDHINCLAQFQFGSKTFKNCFLTIN